jgi:hypothetical protein
LYTVPTDYNTSKTPVGGFIMSVLLRVGCDALKRQWAEQKQKKQQKSEAEFEALPPTAVSAALPKAAAAASAFPFPHPLSASVQFAKIVEAGM